MAERLQLMRTFGVAGWQAWHADGDAVVLPALGACLLRPGTALALRGLWRLIRLWRSGLAAIDAAALRLALCMRREVRLSGLQVRVDLGLPAGDGHATRSFRFALRGQRQRRATLPAAAADCAWTVLRVDAADARTFAAMAAALRAAPRGAQLRLEIAARRSRTPDTLRTDFPLRIEVQTDARQGWLPLIRAARIDAAGTPGGEEGAWTGSTSHN